MDENHFTNNKTDRRLTARVEGRVQGVGFRYSAAREAQKLKLTGYVCNRADGSVEVIAEGPEEALQKLLAWLKRGPSLSYVASVKHQYQNYTGEFRRFTIEYDI